MLSKCTIPFDTAAENAATCTIMTHASAQRFLAHIDDGSPGIAVKLQAVMLTNCCPLTQGFRKPLNYYCRQKARRTYPTTYAHNDSTASHDCRDLSPSFEHLHVDAFVLSKCQDKDHTNSVAAACRLGGIGKPCPFANPWEIGNDAPCRQGVIPPMVSLRP